MARRRQDAEKALPSPPFHLAKAAADPRQVWCLDVHDDRGRRVFVGPLEELEGRLDAVSGDPDVAHIWLFPLVSLADRARYARYARWGRTKIGWQPPERGREAEGRRASFDPAELDFRLRGEEMGDAWERASS